MRASRTTGSVTLDQTTLENFGVSSCRAENPAVPGVGVFSGRGEKLAHGQNDFCGVVGRAASSGGRTRADSPRRALSLAALFLASVVGLSAGAVNFRGQPSSTGNIMPPTTHANPLPQITLKRPLVSLNAACAALDCDSPGCISRCETGDLWAFNLSPVDQHHRRDVRVLSRSLAAVQAGRVAESRALAFATVARIIFPMAYLPGGGTKLKACTVYQRLNIHPTHLSHILAKRLIKPVAGSRSRRGPGGSLEIDFASLFKFLESRRIA